jgi:acetyltransferase
VASEALFKQAGIIRVDTLEELFDVANLLAHQPIPPGRRVAVLTNGGGPGIMVADACASRGLELPILSEDITSQLKSLLPHGASVVNPVDMTAEASAEQYGKALELLMEDAQVDIAIVIFVPPIVTQADAVAKAIRDVAPRFRQAGKPLVASFMSHRGTVTDLGSKEEGYVPAFTFPEQTASALARVCEYRDWLQRPAGRIPDLQNIDRRKAEEIVTAALAQGESSGTWLDADSVCALLNAYGIHTAESRVARSTQEASEAATQIGFPVALKLASETLAHKTEVGGVILDLQSEAEVALAFEQIRERLAALGKVTEMQGVLVQRMISEGVETIVGVTQDPSFGPLMLFGLGGTQAELFKDVTIQIHPLTDIDAGEMVRSVKAYQLLQGWRGSKPADVEAIEELLLRISAMVEDLPQIAELDLNPVKALESGKGYSIVDARVLLHHSREDAQ